MRYRVIVVAAVLLLSAPPAAVGNGLSVEEALSRARERAAGLLGAPVGDLQLLGEYHKAPVTVGSQRFLMTLLSTDAHTDEILLAVDMDSGEVLDEFAYEVRVAAAFAQRDKFSPEARAALGATGEPQTFVFMLARPDYGPAAAAYVAAHPEAQWDDESPITDDPALAEELRLGLMWAKVAVLRAARAPFLAAVEAGGGEVVAMFDLVPMVDVRGSAELIQSLASRAEVGEVLLPSPFSLAMDVAKPAIDADIADGRGLDGSGVKLGIVEYRFVEWNKTGMTNITRDQWRVKLDDVTVCEHLAATSGSGAHMTWVTAIAASKAVAYPGVANDVTIVTASANSSEGAESSDARIRKAAECAVAAGATVINLSLVQNKESDFATSNRFFDELVDVDHVTVVAAAGNHPISGTDHCPDRIVPSPGAGWNVVAVGGYDDNGTAGTGDDELWYRSDGQPAYCWLEPPAMSWDSTNDREKPEISAPAVAIHSSAGYEFTGTSAASPMVAATVATMMENATFLTSEPEEIRAALIAASKYDRTPRPDGSFDSDQEGFGSLNTEWSNRVVDAVGNGHRGRKTYTAVVTGIPGCPYSKPAAQTVTFTGAAGRFIRFAITWNSHTIGGVDSRTTDYNLAVKNPGGVTFGSSSLVASNYEHVTFRVDNSGGPGTYTATITPVRWQCNPSSERLGWAWVSFPGT